MDMPASNLFSFAFVDVSMLLSTMTLKYGRHFGDADQPRHLSEPPFQDCRTIALRGPADGNWGADAEQVDYPLLAEWPSAKKIIADINTQVNGLLGTELQVGQVYVQSLGAGGHIGWHTAETPYAIAHQRFKLLASPCTGGSWLSGGEGLAPVIGNLTHVNNRVLNSALNLGPVPQISLVIDMRRPQLQ